LLLYFNKKERAMSDNRDIRGPQDRKLISLQEDYEIRYWCDKFNVSESELRKAVERVGNSAEAVENALKK
jgi:hypothetical protein